MLKCSTFNLRHQAPDETKMSQLLDNKPNKYTALENPIKLNSLNYKYSVFSTKLWGLNVTMIKQQEIHHDYITQSYTAGSA